MSKKPYLFTQGQWALVRDLETGTMKIETMERGDIAIIPTPVDFTLLQEDAHLNLDQNELDQKAKKLVVEGLANARLIAKAPQLYKLLKQVLQRVAMEHLMLRYVEGTKDTSTAELVKAIAQVLDTIDGGTEHEIL